MNQIIQINLKSPSRKILFHVFSWDHWQFRQNPICSNSIINNMQDLKTK